MSVRYRRIASKDNPQIEKVIKTTLESQGNNLPGTVYTDEATTHLSDGFQGPRRCYFVAEENNVVLGGSGIAEVDGMEKDYCELCRMFLTPEARGKGIGAKLMQLCLEFARSAGYRFVYIETFENMTQARKLYERSGFKYIDYRLGNSGHFSCNVTMLLEL